MPLSLTTTHNAFTTCFTFLKIAQVYQAHPHQPHPLLHNQQLQPQDQTYTNQQQVEHTSQHLGCQ